MSDGAAPPAASRPRSAAWRVHLLPLAALLVCALAPFAEPILRGEAPFFLDLQDHWHPIRLHAHRSLAAGELPHWWQGLFCGVPFLAQPEASLFYPPHWVLDRIDPARTIAFQLVLHRFVLGALFYAAARLRGASRLAAFLAGGLGIFCGVTTHAQQQLAHLRTLCWLPLLVIGATYIATNRPRRGVLALAAATALPIVAGYPAFLQRAILVVPFLLVLDASFVAAPRKLAELSRRAALTVAGIALGVGLAGVQVFPSMAMTEVSQRAMGLDPALLDDLRATWTDLATILLPRPDRDSGVARSGFAYVGSVALVLAILAVVRRRRGCDGLAVVAVFGLVAALGMQTPLDAALRALPGGGTFKNPSQYLVLWFLAMPLLAAHGLDAWRERTPSAREILKSAGGALLLLGVAWWALGPAGDPASKMRTLVAFAAICAVGIAHMRFARRAALAILVGAALLDAGSLGFRYATRKDRCRDVDAVAQRADAPFEEIAAHHAASGLAQPARIISSNAEFNWDNRGTVAGVENVRGLLSLALLRTMDVSRIIEEGAPFPRVPPRVPLYDYGPVRSVNSPRVDLLALRYAAGWQDSPGPAWRRIGKTTWERDAVDAMRFAPRVIAAPATDGFEPWRALAADGFDPVRDVLVEGAPAETLADGGTAAAPGRVLAVTYSANGAVARVAADRAAILLWTESHDAGWRIAIDGAEAPVLRANHGFLAVAVPPGEHEVAFRYRAPGYDTGVRISLAALMVFAVLLLASRRQP